MAASTHEIYLYDLSNTNHTVLEPTNYSVFHVTRVVWSPDGRHFIITGPIEQRIFKILTNNKLEVIYQAENNMELGWFLKDNVCVFFTEKFLDTRAEQRYPEPGGYLITHLHSGSGYSGYPVFFRWEVVRYYRYFRHSREYSRLMTTKIMEGSTVFFDSTRLQLTQSSGSLGHIR